MTPSTDLTANIIAVPLASTYLSLRLRITPSSPLPVLPNDRQVSRSSTSLPSIIYDGATYSCRIKHNSMCKLHPHTFQTVVVVGLTRRIAALSDTHSHARERMLHE